MHTTFVPPKQLVYVVVLVTCEKNLFSDKGVRAKEATERAS